MQLYAGENAFTDFRLQRLLEQLQQHAPELTRLQARFFFVVLSDSDLSASDVARLKSLLAVDAELELSQQNNLLVVPRVGTISPWSSKATDIAHNADLHDVQRIIRGVCYSFEGIDKMSGELQRDLHDPLTESVFSELNQLNQLAENHAAKPLSVVPVLQQGVDALTKAEADFGFNLTSEDRAYLVEAYKKLGRNPTDVELMMFAQVNSEHCRHKIFNASWSIDGEEKSTSLFNMIRNTQKQNGANALSAYCDNAAVLRGATKIQRQYPNATKHVYETRVEDAPIVLKVETHNHPTAISPFPGAATGSGGEIRDEAATGRGSEAKAGLVGFNVSHLCVPNFTHDWELNVGKPKHMASSLQIMLEAPIGAASFNNEFGRPSLSGYFRSFCQAQGAAFRGYHKPIMIAGGVGSIRPKFIHKGKVKPKHKIVVLGGPAMPIGLGGGSASSRVSSEDNEALDFASVQRSNPEMQRRCQEVINRCWYLGKHNPIVSIHDVGAGGLSNAIPEIVHDQGLGCDIQLRDINSDAPGMSPREVWCNEAQERFVLAIATKNLDRFIEIAKRERCPFAVVGEATKTQELKLQDSLLPEMPVDLGMDVLFEHAPKMHRNDSIKTMSINHAQFGPEKIGEYAQKILEHPTVADKSFLITIGDRTVGGFTARDQVVGPWQVPVADVAVTCADYAGYQGEAMAMGERPPIALQNPAASARMAVAEALTNLYAADITDLSHVSLSANWMAAAGDPGEGAALFDAVKAVGMQLCPKLGINIPVGKDSLSMAVEWKQQGEDKKVSSPLSLVITAAGKVDDVRKTLTPQCVIDSDSDILLIDLAKGKQRLGGSILAEVTQQANLEVPDLEDPDLLGHLCRAVQRMRNEGLVTAYHDRSDGGVFACLTEMMFASHCGFDICLDALGEDAVAALFNEELGVCIQVPRKHNVTVMKLLEQHDLAGCTHKLATINATQQCVIAHQGSVIYQEAVATLRRYWSSLSYHMQSLRDNPECAKSAFELACDTNNKGLSVKQSFSEINVAAPYLNLRKKPRVAILREQGVNGQKEMAAAFRHVGFEAVDVHMSDLLSARVHLSEFKGLAACGGFSYGDVLGAGRGWAQSILARNDMRDHFAEFFARNDTFSLGVCNGCQMLSQLKELIPGAADWPELLANQSEQFEARFVLTEVLSSPSVLFQDMQGSVLPVVVAHGEGRAVGNPSQVCLRYVDDQHQATERYPFNPNGSAQGQTGFTSSDGRATILMPHPERVFRSLQCSWKPSDWSEDSPWLRLFANARRFVD